MIEFIIKTLDSRNHDFSVEEEFTVAQVKEKIEERLNLPKNRQKLIFMGKVLHDNNKLKDLGVGGKVMHLVENPPPNREQRQFIPQSLSVGANSGIRVNFRAQRIRNAATRAENRTSLPRATASNSRMRRQMPNAASRPAYNEEPLLYLPTAGRVEIIRRLVSEIKDALNQLKVHLEQTGQMRAFRYTESDDEESMNWFDNRETGWARSRFDTYFQYNNDGPDQHLPFRFSIQRALGNDMAHVIPRDLAVLLEELECLNLRFTPFKKRYIHMLFHSSRRNPLNFNADHAASDQRFMEMTCDIIHSFAHAYHAISDITFHGTQPVPRLSSEMVSLPERNSLPFQRRIFRGHSSRAGTDAATETDADAGTDDAVGTDNAPGKDAASGTDAAPDTNAASATGDASDMDERSRLDEARAVDALYGFSPARGETGTEARGAPRDGNTRQPQENTNTQSRPDIYQIDLEPAQPSGAASPIPFSRLLQAELLQHMRHPTAADIDSVLRGASGRAVMINMGEFPLSEDGNLEQNQQAQARGEDAVYVLQVPREELSNPESFQNIVTTAIRRGIASILPRSTENAGEQQREQSNGQGRQARPVPIQNRPRGVILDNNTYDPFLPCDNIHSFHRLQQRRQGRGAADLSSARCRAETIAARNITYIRDRGCNLSDEHMLMVQQMLEFPPSPTSWLNAFLVVASRYVFTREMLTTEIDEESNFVPNEFISLRSLLRAYMQSLVRQSSNRELGSISENLSSFMMETISGFIGVIATNPQLVHLQANVDVIMSIRSFINYRVRLLYSVLTSDLEETYLAPRYYTMLGEMYVDLLALIQCCVEDEFGLRTIYTMLFAHLMESCENNTTQSLRHFSQAIFNQGLAFIEDREMMIRQHVILFSSMSAVHRYPFVQLNDRETQSQLPRMPSVPPNTPSMVSVGTSTEQVFLLPPTAEIATNTNDGVTETLEPIQETEEASALEPPTAEAAQIVPTTTTTNQQTIYSLIMQHWDNLDVPVLSDDQNQQDAEQPPFSDAYFTGMPSCKRRRIKQSRLPTNLEGFINENFGENNEERVGNHHLEDMVFRTNVRDILRHVVRSRAVNDDDYQSLAYRNDETLNQPSNNTNEEQETNNE